MKLNDLFFDAAGTLIKVREPVGVSYARIAREHQVQVTAEAAEAAFREAWVATQVADSGGNRPRDQDRSWWKDLVRRTFTRAGCDLPSGPAFAALFEALYGYYALPQAWELYPEVGGVLEKLRAHYRLHVLSNFDPRLISVLEGLGIRPFFQEVILSSEVGWRKPDPLIFAHALQRTGATAVASMHIGDEGLADIQGAQNAGMHSFHVQRPEVDLGVLSEKLLG